MRLCIFGAGAIGGLMAARLAAKGDVEVTVIARGPHLAAMQAHGLKLLSEGSETVVRPRCVASAAEAGVQDYVVVTLKAHSLPGAAAQMQPLLGPETAVVSAVNGVPWWYFHGLGGPHEGRVVESVDPGGVVSALLPPARAIGCIVYPAAEVIAPGVIEHTYGDRFSLGEPDGSRSPRAQRLSEALIAAGFKAPVRPRIRDELWVKLWGNLAFNPISALTTATLDVLIADDGQRGVARAMMLEGQRVAEALGVRFAIDVDKRIAGAAEVGAHKTSMLQDLERGRPMEIEALLGAVVELADLVGEPAPTCRTVLALVRARAKAAGCWP
ncbi:2-dehydropantoate 2-reductase [Roseomonas alkaliterrae]|uniref:2-dehydropantoate 2-reductase n=1 Tax=Neoroseomonas alkaliterrae TaxID=1452450 RepID=A0A840XMM4_9PROT|nr:2-dehydropantoate 2-reductase [Neoroseomonas alkaliterrae]MBB5689828.1 2-dehydropantoate 2-reductase [Neoroseomonas alkaliterrae]MBR0675132.1 2-dehydropantoate 2-reductase [Neoroseomonas alkaliterrae]